MASEPLSVMLSGDFAEAHQRDVWLESSPEAMRVFLVFLYNGESLVEPDAIPELLEFAHKWEVKAFQEALHEHLKKHMTPELCSALIVHERAPLSDDLDEMWERYALANFADCVKVDQFGSWPHWRLIGLLKSADLMVSNEEEVLAAVVRWHQAAPDRDDHTLALLQDVQFQLLSLATLQACLGQNRFTGSLGVEISRLGRKALIQ
eukprot:5134681-Amphidinium_carterae.2